MIGPTGRYPRGRLNQKDQGEVTLAVGINPAKKIIEVHFGTELSWIGLGAEEAEVLGRRLLEVAKTLRGNQ